MVSLAVLPEKVNNTAAYSRRKMQVRQTFTAMLSQCKRKADSSSVYDCRAAMSWYFRAKLDPSESRVDAGFILKEVEMAAVVGAV